MIRTSTQYQSKITADVRQTRTLMIAQFNPEVYYPLAAATATSENVSYPVEQLVDGRFREVSYLSYGQGLPIQLQGLHTGWWSSDLSNGSGVMSVPQVILIDYYKEIRSKHFFIVSPSTNYPVAFTIELSTDNATWETLLTETANTAHEYATQKPAYRSFRYLRLTVTKISAVTAPAKILQCGAVTTVCFEFYDSDICKLIEEMRQYNESPLSCVCSSYVECALSNEEGLTDDDNDDSFLSGLLGGNFTFRPWMGLRVTDAPATEEYEFIPLGVFTSNAAEQSTEDITAQFLGYDKLNQIKDLQPPILSVVWDTTVYELFDLMFQGLGLHIGTDYIIDKALTQHIAAGFFAGMVGSDFSEETVGEALQVLAEAGCAYVRCDRFGRIVVRSNFLTGTADATLQDSDFIFSVKKEKDPAAHYDQINVRYREFTGLEDEEELYNSDIDIPLGGGPAVSVEFPDAIGIITQVALQGTTNAAISKVTPGAVRMEIEISNTGAAETGTLVVKGRKLKFFNTHVEKTDVLSAEDEPRKILSISNWLIQDRTVALSFGDSVLHYVSEPFSTYTITERGDPAREIGDHIHLDDNTNDIDKYLQMARRTLTWDGVLTAETECRVALADWRWTRVVPPHLIQCTVTREKTVQSSWVMPGLLCEEEV